MSKPILILGANGQVGRALHDVLREKAVALSRPHIDLTRSQELLDMLEEYDPRAIINASGYTQVDKAEEEEAKAYTVNAQAPAMLAQWCRTRAIPFIHYSTDYVFDGSGNAPWKESDHTAPINAYGRTKKAGEERIVKKGGHFLIFRISWVYDAFGKNFFTTMLRLMQEREELRVVNDQFGAPCYAPHIARATLAALDKASFMPEFPSGIYHLCSAGETTWHGFAQAIHKEALGVGMELACRKITGVSSAQYPTPAKRPANSRLDCALASTILGASLPPWQEGLSECMRVKREYIGNTA